MMYYDLQKYEARELFGARREGRYVLLGGSFVDGRSTRDYHPKVVGFTSRVEDLSEVAVWSGKLEVLQSALTEFFCVQAYGISAVESYELEGGYTRSPGDVPPDHVDSDLVESPQSVWEWADGVFNQSKSDPEVLARKIAEEWAEFEELRASAERGFIRDAMEIHPKLSEELADIFIVVGNLLYRTGLAPKGLRYPRLRERRVQGVSCFVYSKLEFLHLVRKIFEDDTHEWRLMAAMKAWDRLCKIAYDKSVDVGEQVRLKMIRNRLRRWNVDADGFGKHVSEGDASEEASGDAVTVSAAPSSEVKAMIVEEPEGLEVLDPATYEDGDLPEEEEGNEYRGADAAAMGDEGFEGVDGGEDRQEEGVISVVSVGGVEQRVIHGRDSVRLKLSVPVRVTSVGAAGAVNPESVVASGSVVGDIVGDPQTSRMTHPEIPGPAPAKVVGGYTLRDIERAREDYRRGIEQARRRMVMVMAMRERERGNGSVLMGEEVGFIDVRLVSLDDGGLAVGLEQWMDLSPKCRDILSKSIPGLVVVIDLDPNSANFPVRMKI